MSLIQWTLLATLKLSPFGCVRDPWNWLATLKVTSSTEWPCERNWVIMWSETSWFYQCQTHWSQQYTIKGSLGNGSLLLISLLSSVYLQVKSSLQGARSCGYALFFSLLYTSVSLQCAALPKHVYMYVCVQVWLSVLHAWVCQGAQHYKEVIIGNCKYQNHL